MVQRLPGEGPFRVDELHDGDRYELSHGHPIYCGPTGGDGAGRVGLAYEVLATDPAVEEAGVDPGYRGGPKDLRAPDVGIGNVPDRPGFIAGAPPLAVEVAGSGQNEAELALKIEELFAAGTRWIWVIRLLPPRRVEVHERGAPMRTANLGDELTAPGVLQNPVPVRALFDREAGHDVALRNLLQRKGYPSFEAAQAASRAEGEAAGRAEGEAAGRAEGEAAGRAEGEAAGRAEGEAAGRIAVLRESIAAIAATRGIRLAPADLAQLDAEQDLTVLKRWFAAALVATSPAGIFGA